MTKKIEVNPNGMPVPVVANTSRARSGIGRKKSASGKQGASWNPFARRKAPESSDRGSADAMASRARRVQIWLFEWIVVSETKNFGISFSWIFAIGIGVFAVFYTLKIREDMDAGNPMQKIINIALRAAIYALGLTAYTSILFYGSYHPLVSISGDSQFIVISIRTLSITIGIWAISGVSSYIIASYLPEISIKMPRAATVAE